MPFGACPCVAPVRRDTLERFNRKGQAMDGLDAWITPAITIGLFGFIWRELSSLRKDMTALTERMAKLEGLFEGFVRREASSGG